MVLCIINLEMPPKASSSRCKEISRFPGIPVASGGMINSAPPEEAKERGNYVALQVEIGGKVH